MYVVHVHCIVHVYITANSLTHSPGPGVAGGIEETDTVPSEPGRVYKKFYTRYMYVILSSLQSCFGPRPSVNVRGDSLLV